MKRFFSYLLLVGFSLGFIVSIAGVSEATPKKRVAVLYFEDNSRFDSPTGCGCIPGFIGNIFSTKKRWDLEDGFAKILNRKLVETNVYEPVSKDELLDAMALMTLSRHNLKKLNQEQRATLAKHLDADVIVLGNIRKFNQERLRTNASRTLREGGREAQRGTASYTAPVILRGSLHRVTIQLNMKFYDASGDLVGEPRLATTRDHSYAGTKFASLEASVTEEGTNLTFGQTSDRQRKNPRPIVKPTELNEIQFASAEYDRTLFGIVTNEALIKAVLALRDSVGPNFITPWESKLATAEKGKKTPSTAADGPVKGKIVYVDNENPDMIYVNIGSDKGIAINQEFTVSTKGKPVRDIDTGEILTYVPKPIGTLAVSEIQTGKVSIFRVVEIAEPLKIGDVVSEVPPEAPDSETDAPEKQE
ncbi:hypothetical protein F4009_21360 [Candidatus Poribacteria bacterium]|nr:hypothetical protein [Candidatus Poribacteria bacterium]MYA70236.1 hypothetical protein [Candidatus Poribacteria bacterium]MYH79846.1 hypothetical protein [Candidatus Poribacteria bacterium]MYK96511.1 hypothetical protein [Candidatus Poribacteria bacterium]